MAICQDDSISIRLTQCPQGGAPWQWRHFVSLFRRIWRVAVSAMLTTYNIISLAFIKQPRPAFQPLACPCELSVNHIASEKMRDLVERPLTESRGGKEQEIQCKIYGDSALGIKCVSQPDKHGEGF